MAALEEFDREVKELVTSGKLSSSKIKSVTDAAMANIASDAHLVATLFKVHKQAKSSHKISSLYVIDAIAREARQQVKKASKGKQSSSGIATPLHDGAGSGANDDSDEPTLGKRSTKGTYASFLSKIESFLDRLVAEVLSKGPPEHKDKVKKVLDIWKKSTTFSSDALKPCYARLADEVPEANAATKKSNSNRSATAPSGQRSTTPPYPPPDKPIRFPPFPPSFHSNNATPPLFPTQDNTQSTDLAALLGSISASQILPAATAVAPLQPPAPTFEVSQLALLQQLAAQSSSASPFDAPPAVGTAPLAAPMSMPTTFPMPPQMPVPVAAPSFNNDVTQQARSLAPTNGWGGPSGPSQQTRQPSPPREARDRRSQWDRDSRPQAREGRDRRSVSPETERYGQRRQRSPPPARQRSPPYREARQDGWSTRDGKRSTSSRFEQTQSHAAPARQQETRRIATYISEERSDERPGGKGKDARRGADVEDYSSFEVLPSQGGSNSHGQSFLSNNNTQWQPSEEEKAAEELMNSAPNFNPMTFNAADPQSWASFAHMCSNNMGRMPSTMEMMQWIMSSMAMMQAQMSAGGMMMGGMPGNMQGDVSMQGMQDMHNFASFGGNQGSGMGMGMDASSSNNTESWNNYGQQDSKESEPGADASEKQQARDSSIGPDTRPPIPTRDHGEGEEDMQMTPDPEG